MKKSILIAVILLSVATLTTGCDFLRKLAGRPTAAELEAKAEAIETRRMEREKAIADSIETVRKHEADSVAAMDSLAKEGTRLMGATGYGGLALSNLDAKYYIIVGAFVNIDNARRCVDTFAQSGYPGEIIAFKNGYNAVGVCKTDDISRAYESLKELRRQDFCPPQVWILTNQQK